MKGDFTNFHIHKPPKHYTGVLKQQGRVDLDADSNEAHEMAEYLRHTLTRDVIGPCGFPEKGDGFDILGGFFVGGVFVDEFNGVMSDLIEADLAIFPGRGYVDGILCELEAAPFPIDEVLTSNDAGVRVRLPSLVADGRELRRSQAVEFLLLRGGSRAPQVISPPVQIIDADPAERTLTIPEDMRDLARRASGLRRVTTYTTQADYPDPPGLDLDLDELLGDDSGDFKLRRTDLVYLDVWQHHVTAIEDPDILEVALGGPDTTTRVKTVWQVKVMKDIRASGCRDKIEGWPPPPSGGRLSTEAVATPAAEDPCLIAPGGGYRGLENRLYRVEIHRGGDLGEATFKWSRDNGSVVFPVEEFLPDRQVKVRRLGRDQVLRLRTDDWVEVLDEHTEYRQDHAGEVAGTMARIVGIDEEERIITLDRDLPAGAYDVARHARVRRWDQTQNVDADGLVATAAGPILLEDGVQVRFSGNDLKTGDYWVFAARTATGDVERLTDAPPLGIKHHYCRLTLIEWNIALERGEDGIVANLGARSEDCRPTFLPLTEITAGAPTDIRAEDVSFDDGVCELGADNVQEALDALCRRPTEVEDWPTVEGIEWANDMPMPLGRFNEGLIVHFSEPMHRATLSPDTFVVTLELAEEDPVSGFPGYRPFIVRGNVERDDTRALFRPEPNIDGDVLQTWLRKEAEFVEIPRLRCRVMLKGNTILDERTGERPLDGDVFGRLRDDEDRVTGLPTTDLIFPSGDGNKGGDLESWFYLSFEGE